MRIRDAWRAGMNLIEIILFGFVRNLLKVIAWPFVTLADKLDKRIGTLLKQAREKLSVAEN